MALFKQIQLQLSSADNQRNVFNGHQNDQPKKKFNLIVINFFGYAITIIARREASETPSTAQKVTRQI
jgi:hypothetical protein